MKIAKNVIPTSSSRLDAVANKTNNHKQMGFCYQTFLRFTHGLSIRTKFTILSVFLCVTFFEGLYLCVQTYAPITKHSQASGISHNLAAKESVAYEQWQSDNAQSNMYVALLSLRDPNQHNIEATALAQALIARNNTHNLLTQIDKTITDKESQTIMMQIHHELDIYYAYSHAMQTQVRRGDITGAIHSISVDNNQITTKLNSDFTLLRQREHHIAASHDIEITNIASLGLQPIEPLAFAILALTLTVLVIAGGSITNGLRRLTITAQKIAVGEPHAENELPDEGDDEIGILSTAFRNMVVKRQSLLESYRFTAFHDELTKLPNRALLMDRLHQIVSKRYSNHHLWCILFLDLDRFKIINDSLGHEFGDAVLVEAARRLERCVRAGDTLARLGGDEFVILIDDIADETTGRTIADRILGEFESAFTVYGKEVFTSASIGIAYGKIGDDEPDDVLRNADIAMYQAKANGKQRYEIFTDDLLSRAIALQEIETDLVGAVGRDEFRLLYQPIIDLHSRRITGFEALVRWQHPRRGLLGPNEFIALAEETGEIVNLGEWVLRSACNQLQSWRKASIVTSDVRVSVNVSPKQFKPSFLSTVEAALSESGLDPNGLNLEITESVLATNPTLVRSTLLHLRSLGIGIHLDDFGTGYSSLSYVHKFPITRLKIDRSFIHDSGDGSLDYDGIRSPEIVRAIISLADSLGLEVTAEGIETNLQCEQLGKLGCTSGQGFLFAKPLEPITAVSFIGSHDTNKIKKPENTNL